MGCLLPDKDHIIQGDPEDYTFTIKEKKPCGTIPNKTISIDGAVRITSFTGPQGPTPSLAPSGITYGGKLENGNQYGNCEVIILGEYERTRQVKPSIISGCLALVIIKFGGNPGGFTSGTKITRGKFTAKANITVAKPSPPTFSPALLTLPPNGTDTVEITVAPACKYTLTVSFQDELLQILPTAPTTDTNGKTTITVQDLGGGKRDVSVKVSISPELCQGGDVISDTFTVHVEGP